MVATLGPSPPTAAPHPTYPATLDDPSPHTDLPQCQERSEGQESGMYQGPHSPQGLTAPLHPCLLQGPHTILLHQASAKPKAGGRAWSNEAEGGGLEHARDPNNYSRPPADNASPHTVSREVNVQHIHVETRSLFRGFHYGSTSGAPPSPH